MTIPTLVERLRANAKFLHLAGRIGESLLENEAADEIERLRVQVRQADARGDEALRRAHKAEAAQSDPTAWYDSKSGQVDFGSWKPTRKPSAPDAEWLPFYSAPVRPVPAEPVAWVPYCFKDCSNGRAGEYRLSEVEAAPFAMVDLDSWACLPLFASPPPTQPVNGQPDLVLRLQQRCVDLGAYWRAPDDHGVHLTKQQACDLLCTALGVEVEIAGHPLTACDDNDSPWLVCKPCVAEGQCANAAQPTDLFKGMPFAEAKKAIMLLDAEAARGLAISLMIQNGLHEKYAAQPKRKPLSKTQIKEAWDLSCLVETTGTTATLVEHFARAIERLVRGERE